MTVHVAPQETRPARLARLPKLPVFLDLQGRHVVVAGGGEAAAWKAELLAAAGAQVSVFAAVRCAELDALAASEAAVTVEPRAARAADLDGAALAVVAEDDPARAGRLAAAARSRGILVNVVDRPETCDFQFGTIVNRAPVVVAISTDGAAPVLGQAIRRRIEAVLPAALGGWAAAAKTFRTRLKRLLPSREARRDFWERFVDASFAGEPAKPGALAALDRLAQDVRERNAGGKPGEVAIVGAGPGDPELLTMRAVRELQAADVILYDSLVTPAVLELGRREARRVLVGKRAHGAACRQNEICALIVAEARAGRRVVRLKGGDPAVFGRTGEELAVCRAAGIPARIVPGVTSASAAAAALGAPLTDRDHAQRLQFVTGHGRSGGLPPGLDFAALADPRATTVVYMGRRTIGVLAQQLLARGLSPATPAAVVSDASRPAQNVTRTQLAALSRVVADTDAAAPALILIGAALGAEAAGEPQRRTASLDLERNGR
jgi:uroporphyrin-III C-methyltransferase/precorrin-2 dehydrogenase/sirohydrochlorin ferrochelatase